MKILVTGGAGYIGSHLVDFLIEKGHQIIIADDLSSGKKGNANSNAKFYDIDIKSFNEYEEYPENVINLFKDEKFDIVFHLAAVSRTPWAISDPLLTYGTNVIGSANVLESAKQTEVKKVVLASSNIVYAAQTPYKTSKLAMEQVARDYNDLYDLPTVCLRFSNVAGGDVSRQHPDNVLASLAKSKKEKGYIELTGDGEQTRNFTNVNDICEALYRAAGFRQFNKDNLGSGESSVVWMLSPLELEKVRGTEIDIMHPKTWSLNEIAKFFNCEVRYIPERKGDIKHLKMGIGPEKAKELLGFEAKVGLEDYIKSYTE